MVYKKIKINGADLIDFDGKVANQSSLTPLILDLLKTHYHHLVGAKHEIQILL
ncbi:hypothetical protein [Legionella resiliens]|uniref:Uncharacterized protein n=1 Tax=Legionella resiliens TaxID=2905958 RepID=A0ABS8X4Q1_9GAMM|nr:MULTISPECIES: hypothetical protein [unclassified Legionella]MCE0724595.1 hypothetical protein [Legionella sp. 9fVS26]MCE3533748.1 hypothetical protein [Legionella sp. 8cVS16]